MTQTVAFEHVALPHVVALEEFAFQLCRNIPDARDLVQETMLKAYGRFNKFQPGSNCRAWLFEICKNTYLNVRRRKRYATIAVDFQADYFISEEKKNGKDQRELRVNCKVKNSEADCFHCSLGDEVLGALERLPDIYRTAVILCDIEGHSYEEIAGFFGVPVGTIRARIHRARGMLASRLAPYARETGGNYLRAQSLHD